MKYYKILFVFIFVLSCKTEKFQSEEDKCLYFEHLIKSDQIYRGSELMEDPFFKILDSLRIAEGLTKEDYKGLSVAQQLEYGKRARFIANKKPLNPKIEDSLMALQVHLDNKNTKSFLNYIKKFGYPDIKKIGCKNSPDLILLHSQEKYHKEIKRIIDSEFNNGRINSFLYASILRHIGGRKENNLNKILIENNTSILRDSVIIIKED